MEATATPATPPPTSPLAGIVHPADYQQRSAHIFPGIESLRWYIRQHRAGLEDAGALLLIAGRHWIAPEPFDSYVLEAGRRAAKARSSEGTAA